MPEAPGAESAAERAVLEGIRAERLLELLDAWIPLRSDGGRETAMQRSVARELERRGLAVEVSEIDLLALRGHPAWSAEIERREGLGVLGTLPGKGGGRSLILNGHVDVVPAGDESRWTRPPWRATVEDGRVYGRGACDMKGGLACAVVAAAAIREAGVALAGSLMVQSVIGEEDGGCGTLAAAVAGLRADGAVIAEPTGLTVATAQAGALNFRLHVRGRAAHAAVRREGVSAIEKLPPLLAALEAHERRLNEDGGGPLFEGWPLPFPLCVGTVRGGEWASTVPESLVCEGRLGVPVGSDAAAARRGLEQAIAEAAAADPWLARNPPWVEWWGGQFEPAAIPADHELVQTLSRALPDAGGPDARVAGVPYGSDLRLLVREAATPAVLFGPGDLRQAHAADEFVPVEQLVLCARALALTAVRFCGT